MAERDWEVLVQTSRGTVSITESEFEGGVGFLEVGATWPEGDRSLVARLNDEEVRFQKPTGYESFRQEDWLSVLPESMR